MCCPLLLPEVTQEPFSHLSQLCFSYLFKNPTGQGSIVSSLLPTNEQQPDISAGDISLDIHIRYFNTCPVGQLLCGGLFSPDPVSNWLCSAALSHVFIDTEEMKVEAEKLNEKVLSVINFRLSC